MAPTPLPIKRITTDQGPRGFCLAGLFHAGLLRYEIYGGAMETMMKLWIGAAFAALAALSGCDRIGDLLAKPAIAAVVPAAEKPAPAPKAAAAPKAPAAAKAPAKKPAAPRKPKA